MDAAGVFARGPSPAAIRLLNKEIRRAYSVRTEMWLEGRRREPSAKGRHHARESDSWVTFRLANYQGFGTRVDACEKERLRFNYETICTSY
jgi:hypothetical protein